MFGRFLSTFACKFKPQISRQKTLGFTLQLRPLFSGPVVGQKVLSLNTVQLPKGTEKKKKRIGRGGKGKTAGRGRKGWKAKHSQSRNFRAFEGGQSSIAKKFPKIGVQHKSALQAIHRDLRPIHMDKLQLWIDLGRLDASKTITVRDICLSGLAGKVKDGVVLLAKGAEFFKTKVDIEVTKASQGAIGAIEAHGGTVTVTYTDKERIRSLLHPEKYSFVPETIVPPTRRLVAMYADPVRRGYLSTLVKDQAREDMLETILANAGATIAKRAEHQPKQTE
ncbi:YmL10 [Kappamyces sp. JEL0680]|nr:YmL10 [Kappamyces sp. JEL0680]